MPGVRPSPPSDAVNRPKALRLDESRTVRALRDGEGPRRLSPARRQARSIGAACIETAAHRSTRAEVAEWFGATSDRVGAEILSGRAPVTLGEAVMLPPLDVTKRAVLEALRLRYERELASDDLPDALRARCGADLALIAALLATSSAA
jgi:hypothetical protein